MHMSNFYDSPKPASYCSSLRKLSICESPQLLSNYQLTAEELRRQLPNVTELVTDCEERICEGSFNFVGTMLQAWGDQLISLELPSTSLPRLHQCTRLQSLKLRSFSSLPQSSPSISLQNLSELSILCRISESFLGTILSVPSLRAVTIGGFEQCLQEDWSGHQCTWQQLTIHTLCVVDLGKLPLHSLKGNGCLVIQVSKCVVCADMAYVLGITQQQPLPSADHPQNHASADCNVDCRPTESAVYVHATKQLHAIHELVRRAMSRKADEN